MRTPIALDQVTAPAGLMPEVADKRVLLVGLGGLGCPIALGLVQAGVGRLLLCDDDVVDETNLHRQILFHDSDVGRDKLEAGLARLTSYANELGSPTQVETLDRRFLPENARSRVREVDLVIEGADNYPTKFLVADTCRLERRPAVHSAAVGWTATAWSVAPSGRPCYRCLFEDIPDGHELPNCSNAGVMGPVVGLGGALAADLALSVLVGEPRYGELVAYDGWLDRLRWVPVAFRSDCQLCGPQPTIFDMARPRYKSRACVA